MGRVVDQNQARKITAKDAEVFHVSCLGVKLVAVMPIETESKYFALRV